MWLNSAGSKNPVAWKDDPTKTRLLHSPAVFPALRTYPKTFFHIKTIYNTANTVPPLPNLMHSLVPKTIVILPLWSGHIVAHSKSKPMFQQGTCYWHNKGPYTLHTNLQRFFWKNCCENPNPYLKLLKKLLQSWKKVAMCMDDNCSLSSFVFSVRGP